MTTREFDIYTTDFKTPHKVKLEQIDEVYMVYLDGEQIGSMEIDLGAEFGFSSDDEKVKPLIEDIASQLQQSTLREGFPIVLKEIWGENIISIGYNNYETLMVVVHPDIDMQEFGSVIQDSIYDIVSFDERLNLILSKTEGGEVFEIGIN
ncbi:hypothetical protein [Pedobacter sp. CFBP9032]|uniref:hypothetical protein n=1 Tax=Pedobacter sp. CFBP9032 TaxID=3096539 RepID=UPI002A6A1A06|nr:hypothetical protein [Pedobacter sp. CFBP9032]MDY0905615.1 hypothetical protein [Pedobacter sp. CFBP9032]